MRYVGDDQTQFKRFTVAEAAQHLGISPEAVRSRLYRGTLDKESVGGTVYVRLNADQIRPSADQATDRARPSDVLIEDLREQVRYLRAQLDQEREANREKIGESSWRWPHGFLSLRRPLRHPRSPVKPRRHHKRRMTPHAPTKALRGPGGGGSSAGEPRSYSARVTTSLDPPRSHPFLMYSFSIRNIRFTYIRNLRGRIRVRDRLATPAA
jgi:hypothetical protein